MKKKLLVVVFSLGMAAPGFCADNVAKRLNIARAEAVLSARIYDAVQDLIVLKDEYASMSDPFQDSDFQGATATDLKYLDAFNADAMLSIVTPALAASILDAGNGNFNKNVMLKVRK